MANQYEVLGKAPGSEDLKKLSSDNVHLTIKNLSAGYGKMEILHNLDLYVSKAQSLCLIGPNGAGKSTLLRLASNLIQPTSGSVEYLNNKKPIIGFVFQDFALFPHLNVKQNIEFSENGNKELFKTLIDKIDAQIVKLLNRRTKHVLGIGQAKLASGKAIYQPDREQALLRRICKVSDGVLPDESLSLIHI